MDLRKVISLGKSSFAIILPKDWILENNIKKKDKLEVYTCRDGKLVIQKEAIKTKIVEILNADLIPIVNLYEKIKSIYILNVNEIVLYLDDEANFTPLLGKILEFVKNFQGLNVKFEKKNQIHIVDLLDVESIKIETIFEELMYLFNLVINQIRSNVFLDNPIYLSELERKFLVGLRYLNYQICDLNSSSKTPMDSISQVLFQILFLENFKGLIYGIEEFHQTFRVRNKTLDKLADLVLNFCPIMLEIMMDPNIQKLRDLEQELLGMKEIEDLLEREKDEGVRIPLVFFKNLIEGTAKKFLTLINCRLYDSGIIFREVKEPKAQEINDEGPKATNGSEKSSHVAKNGRGKDS
ncbi:MAG: AbrB/MazE/SpoVT family DNA-binding domain-containing protein [Promethearchaeota archaeon]